MGQAQIPVLNGATPGPPPGYQNARWQQGSSLGPDPTYGVPQIPDSCYVPNAGIAVVKTANYTLSIADLGKLIIANSASPITFTLPNPVPLNALSSPTTETRWTVRVANIGTGTLTIAHNSLQIDGAAADLNFAQFTGCAVFTDGTNYFTQRGATPSLLLQTNSVTNGSQSKLNLLAGSNVTLTDSGTGNVTITAAITTPAPVIDILSPDKPTGTLAYQKNEFATVAAGATINLLNYSGGSPGYVDWITLQLKDTGGADPSNMTVKVYYDGSATATISCPLQNFFMATYAILNGPTAISSCFHGFSSNHTNSQVSFYFRLPIPFNTGIKIDLVNTTAQAFSVWSACEYQTGVANNWPYTRVLHVDATQQSGLAANSVNTLVNYTGGARGRFVGLWLLEDDFPGSVSPHGAPLEGNIKLFIDGSSTESAQSSGTEDWFGGGFYFAANGTGGTGGGNSSQIQPGYKDGSGEIGITYMSTTAFLTEGAFRFHVHDKRVFNSGLKLTWNCGDTSEIPFTGTGTIWSTVFYYTES